ncbi:hypothetical protein BP5796_01454 [Coleophoma crateriformis]|uniref:ABM domain-containing protein n=1 Tax=Coleophoma crateriformis TaxID=565419 RepID=A0A3D8T0L3_9HELO|nr:hypothetical protein BP5796_01454 [Coleophoma crateriformis]
MAITELIVPLVKQDEASVAYFNTTFKETVRQTVATASGIKSVSLGKIILHNNVDVSSELKPMISPEWHDPQSFYAFVTSPEFTKFKQAAMPILLGPPTPQLFETDVSATAVFAAPLTEILQFSVASGDEDQAKILWNEFVDVVGKETHGKVSEFLHGTSLNLEEGLFVGMVAWASLEERKLILGLKVVAELITRFQALEKFDCCLVDFQQQ